MIYWMKKTNINNLVFIFWGDEWNTETAEHNDSKENYIHKR